MIKAEDFKPGVKFISDTTQARFEVLEVKKALFADSYNVIIRNLDNGRKSIHGLNYLTKLNLHIEA